MLKGMGADPTLLIGGKIVVACPFSDHGGGKSNLMVDPGTGVGVCNVCGSRAFDDLILLLGEKMKRGDLRDGVVRTNDKSKKGFTILPWDEFEKISFPENAWRVNRLIPRSGVTIIAAPSGEKKSWLCMELARCVAEGRPFLGNPEFAVEQCKVLYFENETPPDVIQRRGKMLGYAGSNILIYQQDGPPLNTDDTVKDLLCRAIDQGVGLVIIDTIRSVAGGLREEKAEEVRAFLDRFKQFNLVDITVVLTDHCRKPQHLESRTVPKKEQLLGSQDKVAAATALIMMRSELKSEEIFVHPLKLKVDKELDAFKVLMAKDGDRISFSYAGEIEEQTLKVEEAKELINTMLNEASEPQDVQHIIEALRGDAGKTAVEKALKEMRESDEIGHRKEGKKIVYFRLPSMTDVAGDAEVLFAAPAGPPTVELES